FTACGGFAQAGRARVCPRRSKDGFDLVGPGIRHTEGQLMPLPGPTTTQGAARVACAKDTDLHGLSPFVGILLLVCMRSGQREEGTSKWYSYSKVIRRALSERPRRAEGLPPARRTNAHGLPNVLSSSLSTGFTSEFSDS